jgi:hypothetical protein
LAKIRRNSQGAHYTFAIALKSRFLPTDKKGGSHYIGAAF